MRSFALFFAVLLIAGCGSKPKAPAATEAQTPPAVDVSFSRDIQPILTQNCIPCHTGTPDAKSPYLLATYEGVMGGGKDSVPNVIAGKPDSSLLYQKLKTGKMPPAGKLPADQFELVKKWIAQGAKND